MQTETKNNAMYIVQNYSVSLVALIVPLKIKNDNLSQGSGE